ncbi:NAD-dependent epimerase/dehydratase family protein [Ferruginibacter lapsinanis]|uniref:CmcI family methyltransferase n=1 Tax=Ferruginibacter lapsinanis TaxID=563172 RepID=UPI001E293E2F|nr:CmcI family methyltransferase [Ferruginibacter lapsinanis]UEG49050.1 NAD-dependent epimerase/dehydratase family protein [Ferruginibacter lapsinanis]
MEKILVTGATGFVGNYVITELLKLNCKVIATSTSVEKATSFEWFQKVTFVPFNLNEFDNEINYYEFFNKPDAIIHLAWQGLPDYKGDFHIQRNLPLHTAFIKNLIVNGVKNVTITGTCLEYGMQEGCLSEEMPLKPMVPYAVAKNSLREYIESLKKEFRFSFKWARLFYMYGKGQNERSLIPQLEKAVATKETIFNMSGGEQTRDFLPVETIAAYICALSLQKSNEGVFNCCSGNPLLVKDFISAYLKQHNYTIQLNLGYYPYPDYEPMHFWGNNKKITMVNKTHEFEVERRNRIAQNGANESLKKAAKSFNDASNSNQYSYNFSWMGRPIIQYPQDMIAMQELIWEIKPDLIIETGIAHGGSLIYYASLLELIGNGEVLGIDIDIRSHNKIEIEKHPMFKRISMIQGSSIDEALVEQVKEIAKDKQTILVVLDSNHTHEHVLRELELYAPFVSVNSYIVVFDTIVQDLPENYFKESRPWGIDNNPKTAVWEFLEKNKNFEINQEVDNKLLISVAPSGYLKRTS